MGLGDSPLPVTLSRYVLLLVTLLFAAAPTSIDEDPRTELELALQGTYLGRRFVLRADVKVQDLVFRPLDTKTFTFRPDVTIPITMVGLAGVYYSSEDFAQEEVFGTSAYFLPMPIFMNPTVRNSSNPSQEVLNPPQDLPFGGALKMERKGKSRVTVHAGELAQVADIQTARGGIQLTLQGFFGAPSRVVLRGVEESADSVDYQLLLFEQILGKLVFLLPSEGDELDKWIDPDWDDTIKAAIRTRELMEGMTPLQVLLAWGTPAYAAGGIDSTSLVWTFRRGETLNELLSNQTQVLFIDGQVVQVGQFSPLKGPSRKVQAP